MFSIIICRLKHVSSFLWSCVIIKVMSWPRPSRPGKVVSSPENFHIPPKTYLKPVKLKAVGGGGGSAVRRMTEDRWRMTAAGWRMTNEGYRVIICQVLTSHDIQGIFEGGRGGETHDGWLMKDAQRLIIRYVWPAMCQGHPSPSEVIWGHWPRMTFDNLFHLRSRLG